jgi:c(7)-type cytochrome triheme protein
VTWRPARVAVALLALAVTLPAASWERPIPHTYGRVVLDGSSTRAGVPPVAFDHWSHRGKFTCRLCHVDIGFAMSAGETRISATTNRDHFHCGACHDGKTTYLGRAIFPACSDAKKLEDSGSCRRCHAGRAPDRSKEYEAMASKLPRDAFGLVDWQKAEADWRVRPVDHLEGISIARKRIDMNREVAIESKGAWMSDVLFSHRKHAVWNGCEVCHPDIFPSTKQGEVRYTMLQISSGQACGACHEKVAFPIAACERCHVKPVR